MFDILVNVLAGAAGQCKRNESRGGSILLIVENYATAIYVSVGIHI